VGSRFGTRVGIASALLIASSPPFLIQLAEPSPDLPAAAAWTIAVAYVTGGKPRHAVSSGVAAAIAILFVPGLFRLAAVIALFILFRPERTRAQRTRAAMTYIAAAAATYVLGAVLFAAGNLQPASANYLEREFEGLFGWLAGADLVLVALALLAPVVLPGAVTVLLLGMCVVTAVIYLPSVSLAHWSSVRGLLPALPLAFVLGTAVVDAAWRRWILPRRKALEMVRR
jgi:hypothetical protein